jgi:hypothetical protein
LIVEVPEAEPAVAVARSRVDRFASLGVPPHVTALVPWVEADAIDARSLRLVGDVTAALAPFDYSFSSTGWFGVEVVYLAPDQPAPFIELTERLWAAFPDYPPYAGQFAEITPHLTFGEGTDVETLRGAEAVVLAHGPVRGRASRLTLMTEDHDGRWSPLGSWTFGHHEDFVRAARS